MTKFIVITGASKGIGRLGQSRKTVDQIRDTAQSLACSFTGQPVNSAWKISTILDGQNRLARRDLVRHS